MKTVAMHQPHYFPWLGYLDKMAKADEFVVLDEVQFTDGSPMSRNRFLQVDGEAKLLSLSVEKKGYLEKPTRDVRLSNWPKTRKKHRGFIECNYRKTPYFDEVMPLVAKVLEADCDTLLDLDMASIEMLRSAYGVETPLVLQSSLPYDTEARTTIWSWAFAGLAGPTCTSRAAVRERTWTTGRSLKGNRRALSGVFLSRVPAISAERVRPQSFSARSALPVRNRRCPEDVQREHAKGDGSMTAPYVHESSYADEGVAIGEGTRIWHFCISNRVPPSVEDALSARTFTWARTRRSATGSRSRTTSRFTKEWSWRTTCSAVPPACSRTI